jgi:hypothetical protein
VTAQTHGGREQRDQKAHQAAFQSGEQQEKLRKSALDHLRTAIAQSADQLSRTWAENDPDLASLKTPTEAEFKLIVERLPDAKIEKTREETKQAEQAPISAEPSAAPSSPVDEGSGLPTYVEPESEARRAWVLFAVAVACVAGVAAVAVTLIDQHEALAVVGLTIGLGASVVAFWMGSLSARDAKGLKKLDTRPDAERPMPPGASSMTPPDDRAPSD